MERIVHIAKGHADAEKWDILQQIMMSPRERMAAAKQLRKRFYGNKTIGIREWAKKKW